jgi:diguanylate cyclase (GGDEF)-like protein
VVGVPGSRPADETLRARRGQILNEMSARETPRVALMFAILVAAYDIATRIGGMVEPSSYYAVDLVQAAFFVAAAYLIWSGRLPARYAPAAFATTMVISNAALNYQFTVDGASNTLGIIAICLVASGALILVWRPFLIAAAAMAVLTTATLYLYGSTYRTNWIMTCYLALAISAVLLYARWRSAMSMAIASVTIEEIATRDPLTGLLNRRGLTLMAAPVSAIAYRQREPMFAVFIDIVGLKRVNDTFGHPIGDTVIERTARAVQHSARSADLVTRWGGDEFLVIGIGPQPDEVVYLERVHAHLDMHGLEDKWTGSLSIGISTEHGGNVDELIAAADAAMYIARSADAAREKRL